MDDKPDPRFLRKWIEDRYGPISITQTDKGMLATVPVMNGTAHGHGQTEEKAVDALYEDLTLLK